MVDLHRSSAIDWKPSPVVALSTSTDHSQVAAAREDGSLEIWLVSPGSVGWHHQLTIHGDPNYRVSSLLWCHCGVNATPSKRLFSSGIDGSVFEWDLFELKQKVVLQSIGVSIWQMAAPPLPPPNEEPPNHAVNGFINGGRINSETDSDSSDSDGDDNDDQSGWADESLCIATGCDDGCVRLFHVSLSNSWSYHKASPRVSGRILSVAWSSDSKTIYAGSSDGAIRCWNSELSREIHRITVGSGRPGSELCVWSLIALKCGTLVSADSTGSVQFWDTLHGTLLQSYSYHKGDANVLAVSPNHKRVFSAGSDGQVILYKRSDGGGTVTRQWSYIGYVRAHTHDVRALTVAVPIIHVSLTDDERGPKRNSRTKKKPAREYSYHKWAHAGVPMLVSAGDDTKMFAYSVNDFTKFSPHDICPAPQRVPVQLVLGTAVAGDALLAQCRDSLDIYSVRTSGNSLSTLELFTRVKSRKSSGGILCSAISASGTSFAYSDRSRPSLFAFEVETPGKRSVVKRRLPRGIPSAHCMTFGTGDSPHLFLAGHDRRIYAVNVELFSVVTTFTPCRDAAGEEEPPITKMVCSWDGQWLAAVNCSGDIYVFSLELQRQHWFVSRLDGAAVTAVGFPPQSSEALIVTTSSNQVYSLDVEAKQLGEWSLRNASALPRRYREFPGEVIGLSFVPSSASPAAIIYSASAMCVVNFTMPVGDVTDPVEAKGGLKRKLLQNKNNFEFIVFRDPVLFVGYLSDKSVLIVDKKWIDVVNSLDTLPVHRHIYGT